MVTLLASDSSPEPDLRDGRLLGLVSSVDADRIEVTLGDPSAATGVAVSDLVAIPTSELFLMGVVAGIVRHSEDRIVLTLMPVGSLSWAESETLPPFSVGGRKIQVCTPAVMSPMPPEW